MQYLLFSVLRKKMKCFVFLKGVGLARENVHQGSVKTNKKGEEKELGLPASESNMLEQRQISKNLKK